MSVVVTFFGGPRDGDVTEVMGAHIEMYELIPGPEKCLALHYKTHRYNYLRLDNGRMMAVYDGAITPYYPCMVASEETRRRWRNHR